MTNWARQLISHKKVVHEGIRYPCDECEHVATRSTHLKAHKNNKHRRKKHFCDQCDYEANWPSQVENHKKIIHNGKNKFCEQNPPTIENLGVLKEDTNPRNQYESVTSSFDDLKDRKKDQSVKQYKCDHCDFVTTQSDNLDVHIKSIHEHFCQWCDFVSSSPNGLESHKNTAHKEMKLFCENIEAWQLANPFVREENMYPCDECDWSAATPEDLKVHKKSRQHVSPNIFSDLNQPNDSHKESLQTTGTCGATSPDKSENHKERIHEGDDSKDVEQKDEVHEENAYPCDQCEFLAIRPEDLTQHVMSIHDGAGYFCDKCDYFASRECALKKHIEAKHENITQFDDLVFYEDDNSDDAVAALRSCYATQHSDEESKDKARYSCDQCDYETFTLRGIKIHERLHVKNDEKNEHQSDNENIKKYLNKNRMPLVDIERLDYNKICQNLVKARVTEEESSYFEHENQGCIKSSLWSIQSSFTCPVLPLKKKNLM